MNRGGDFARPDRRAALQLQAARYHDDDRSCDYECMAAESLDRALTSHLGGQAFAGRAAEIAVEWECPTPELLAARDPRGGRAAHRPGAAAAQGATGR